MGRCRTCLRHSPLPQAKQSLCLVVVSRGRADFSPCLLTAIDVTAGSREGRSRGGTKVQNEARIYHSNCALTVRMFCGPGTTGCILLIRRYANPPPRTTRNWRSHWRLYAVLHEGARICLEPDRQEMSSYYDSRTQSVLLYP